MTGTDTNLIMIRMKDLRMNILNDYVDKFVITEGNMTFSGLPKESHFLNNKDRFAKWEDKIILNQIELPDLEGPWHREIYSRNAMVRPDIFNDDDLILMSDGDEIPNPEILEHASEWVSDDTHFTFEQSCYAYWELNNLQLAQIIADVQGKELKYDMVDFHSTRPGHDLRYALSGEKMRKMGWEPENIRDRIREVVEWTLANERWIKL